MIAATGPGEDQARRPSLKRQSRVATEATLPPDLFPRAAAGDQWSGSCCRCNMWPPPPPPPPRIATHPAVFKTLAAGPAASSHTVHTHSCRPPTTLPTARFTRSTQLAGPLPGMSVQELHAAAASGDVALLQVAIKQVC